MDALKWQLIVDEYIADLKKDQTYLELKQIYQEIKTKYFYLLSDFIKIKSELSKANKYYPNYEELKLKYQQIKTKLYEKEEVKKYFLIQHDLEDKINKDIKAVYEKVI